MAATQPAAQRRERVTPNGGGGPVRPRSRKYMAGERPHTATHAVRYAAYTTSTHTAISGPWTVHGMPRVSRMSGNGRRRIATTAAVARSSPDASSARRASAGPAGRYVPSADAT